LFSRVSLVWIVLLCRVDEEIDFARYLAYVRFCLRHFEFPREKWVPPEEEGLMFHVSWRTLEWFVPGAEPLIFGVVERVRRAGKAFMGEATDEKIVKAYQSGRVLDYRPEVRMREFEIWRYLSKKIEEIREGITKILLEMEWERTGCSP